MLDRRWVADLIRAHDAAKPRSTQVEVGCSELGEVCDRKLAYRALGVTRLNTQSDVLAAWIGTQCHEGMQAALQAADRWGEWQTEVEVKIPAYGLLGHVDAWHAASGTVVDWKFVGETSMRKNMVRIDPQYRTQVHLYGFALAQTLGVQVSTVSVVFIPRGSGLHRIHVWDEAYDEAVVEAALQRWHNINVVVEAYGDEALRMIKANKNANCMWCPYFNRQADEKGSGLEGCPGWEDQEYPKVQAWDG